MADATLHLLYANDLPKFQTKFLLDVVSGITLNLR